MSTEKNNLVANEENTEFTWAPLVPLIGGFPIGVEKAFGKPPVLIAKQWMPIVVASVVSIVMLIAFRLFTSIIRGWFVVTTA